MINLGIRRRFLLAEITPHSAAAQRMRAAMGQGRPFMRDSSASSGQPANVPKLRFRAPFSDFNWRAIRGVRYTHAFLSVQPLASVSVRIAESGADLIVACSPEGLLNPRIELPVPVAEAHHMLQQCEGPRIERLSRRFCYGSHFWQIDEYLNDNQGLVLAEVDLQSADDGLDLPYWVGEEVTGDPAYDPMGLLTRPFVSRQHSVLQAPAPKPCPFCGAASAVEVTDTDKEGLLDPQAWVFHLVRCQAGAKRGGCGAQGPWADSPEEAVRVWGERVNLRTLAEIHLGEMGSGAGAAEQKKGSQSTPQGSAERPRDNTSSLG